MIIETLCFLPPFSSLSQRREHQHGPGFPGRQAHLHGCGFLLSRGGSPVEAPAYLPGARVTILALPHSWWASLTLQSYQA